MLEHLVNEDTEQAKEIFHQIVVEKSRQIYENILAEDFELEAKEEDDEEDMDEAKDEEDEDESVEEATDEEDEEDMDEGFAFGEGEDDIGGDASDDQLDDISADDEGDDEFGGDDMGDEEGSDDLEDRVVDLEDAIDDLRAEFEKMMGDEGGDDMGGDDMDMDMGGDDMDMGDDDMDAEPMKMGMADDVSFMREYIEKVANPKHGDDGANTKSIVAGKNDMGGTSANIVAGGESTSGGTKGGLANPSTKEDNAGNVNVPGGKAGIKHLKKVSSPKGGDDGDKSAGSPLNGVKSRAK